MINVTKTFLPPQNEYQAILQRAWETGWLTNRGVLVQQLEIELKKFLGVDYIIAMTNGTLPLQIAIKALGLTGEIITTPFSYVATTSSIVWEGCQPVFVDIHPDFLTIDESKIEAAITDKTSAILATHVYGNPCNVAFIEDLARQNNLKIIYDAAHCFGVTYNGQSIFNYGDISTCSFHATKLFHTGEGGALFTRNEELYNKLFSLHNFGHKGKEKIDGIGINAKMSELQGAMGLSVLPYMDEILANRKKICKLYDSRLKYSNIKRLKIREATIWNYSYYPILFKSEEQLSKVKAIFESNEIYSRRYFNPPLNTLSYVSNTSCPVSESISKRVLCLPLYYKLDSKFINLICKIINEAL